MITAIQKSEEIALVAKCKRFINPWNNKDMITAISGSKSVLQLSDRYLFLLDKKLSYRISIRSGEFELPMSREEMQLFANAVEAVRLATARSLAILKAKGYNYQQYQEEIIRQLYEQNY